VRSEYGIGREREVQHGVYTKAGHERRHLLRPRPKTLPVVGRFSVGYYGLNKKASVAGVYDRNGEGDDNGLLASWDRDHVEISDKLWVAIDYQAGRTPYGATSLRSLLGLRENVSVIFGYDIFNNKDRAGRPAPYSGHQLPVEATARHPDQRKDAACNGGVEEARKTDRTSTETSAILLCSFPPHPRGGAAAPAGRRQRCPAVENAGGSAGRGSRNRRCLTAVMNTGTRPGFSFQQPRHVHDAGARPVLTAEWSAGRRPGTVVQSFIVLGLISVEWSRGYSMALVPMWGPYRDFSWQDSPAWDLRRSRSMRPPSPTRRS